MICNKCKISMNSGTSYQMDKKRVVAKRYYRCPVCHKKIYVPGPNIQTMMKREMDQYVKFYCSENNKELKRVVNRIINKSFQWIDQKDYDDLYSIAALVVWECEKKYDKSRQKNFEQFLISCIRKKIMSQVTYSNRKKRKAIIKGKDGDDIYLHDESLNAPLETESSSSLMDIIESYINVEKEVCESIYSKKMQRYLDNISEKDKKVLFLIAEGYTHSEIKQRLHISEKELISSINTIRSPKNVMIFLYK